MITVLPDAQASDIRKLAIERFARGAADWPLWERMDGPSVRGVDAWRHISLFPSLGGSVVFWEPRTERKVLRFRSGSDLVAVLDECHRSEFYVTDDEVTYLLCFNHHDYLIGQGLAASWVSEYIKGQQRTPRAQRIR